MVVFQKIRISEIRNGRTVSQMIDGGGKILADNLYLNYDVKKLISDLVNESKFQLEMEIEELKKAVLSDNI